MLCIRTYVIKLIIQRGHSIPLNAPISATKEQLTALVFVDNTDIPVEGESTQEVHNNLQKGAITWAGGIRLTGGTLRSEKCFWKMVDFD